MEQNNRNREGNTPIFYKLLDNMDWFWRGMDKIASSPGGKLYPLFEKIIERRYAEINVMTDQKRLFHIYKSRGLGWHTALLKISDPEICEKIYYASKFQKDFNEYTTFYRKMHLICHMSESVEKQKLLAEEIQKDLEAVKHYSERRRRAIQNDIYGGTETEQFEKRLKADAEYAEFLEDVETRSRLQYEAMHIKANLPFPIMGPKYR